MSVVLLGSTSGSITLQEPAVAGTTVLTLPATTGTVVLQNGSNNLLMNSGYGSDAVAYGCRAWVNFDGTGTPAIRASGNVTSITDNAIGDYTVNFTTAMPDANYSFVTSAFRTTDETFVGRSSVAPTASAVRLLSFNRGGATVDPDYFLVSIFR